MGNIYVYLNQYKHTHHNGRTFNSPRNAPDFQLNFPFRRAEQDAYPFALDRVASPFCIRSHRRTTSRIITIFVSAHTLSRAPNSSSLLGRTAQQLVIFHISGALFYRPRCIAQRRRLFVYRWDFVCIARASAIAIAASARALWNGLYADLRAIWARLVCVCVCMVASVVATRLRGVHTAREAISSPGLCVASLRLNFDFDLAEDMPPSECAAAVECERIVDDCFIIFIIGALIFINIYLCVVARRGNRANDNFDIAES